MGVENENEGLGKGEWRMRVMEGEWRMRVREGGVENE